MRPRHLVPAAVLLAVLATPRILRAQALASEHGTVSQTVDGTTITIEYYRPQMRGRVIFGKQVPWGRLWTGANWATTLDVDHDILLEGHAVPAGKYGVWLIPQPETWTLVLHRTARAFHTSPPPDTDELFRAPVKPASGPSTEVVTWSFPVVGRRGTELHMQWSTIDLPLHIAIDTTSATRLDARQRAAYLGTYVVSNADSPAFLPDTVVVYDSAGVLRMDRKHHPAERPMQGTFDLAPSGEHEFLPVLYRRDGTTNGPEPAFRIVFQFAGDHASGFELRQLAAVAARATLLRAVSRP